MTREEKLEYQHTCMRLLKSIKENPNIDMNSVRNSVHAISPFFITLIPDKNQRHHKLRNLFRSKISEGDDIILRIVKEIVATMPEIAKRTVKPYEREYREMMEVRRTKKVKQ